MLDIKFIRENKEVVATMLKNRNKNADLVKLLTLDDERRKLIGKIDSTRAKQKTLGKKDVDKAKILKEEIKKMELELRAAEEPIAIMLEAIPNMTMLDVPVGKDDSENKEIKKVSEPTKLDFTAKDHIDLGESLNIIDMERAAKVSGSRFTYLKGGAASLQYALMQYAHDLLVKKEGFIPIIPPVIVKRETAASSGHPEATGDEAYHIEQNDLFLVGTSEQSILPMYKDEILDAKELPLRYMGYSSCFRREAGSYGKDTKGILRVHQFDKLEMFVYCKPQDSEAEHQNLLHLEEELMQGLELPYRVVVLCSGDLGFPSAKTYDIETWMPAQKKYRETHSTSNCTDYQARRLNIKYKNTNGKNEYIHTLNGTALAIGRILVAIMENNQQKDGTIKVPKVLQQYCGLKIIK